MKKIIASCLLLALCASNSWCDEATKYVHNTISAVFSVVNNQKIDKDAKKKNLEKYLSEIDFNYNGKAVAGVHWKEMNDQQKGEFIKGYKKFLMRTWSDKFIAYSGAKFHTADTSIIEENGDSAVMINVTSSEGAKFDVEIHIRKNDAGIYKITNIVAEGINMIRTYNAEFDGYLDSHTIEELIKYLGGN